MCICLWSDNELLPLLAVWSECMFPSALAYCLLCKQIYFHSFKQNYSENCFTFSPSWLDCLLEPWMQPPAICEHLTQKQRVDQDAGRDSCSLGTPEPGNQDLSRVAGYWNGPALGTSMRTEIGMGQYQQFTGFCFLLPNSWVFCFLLFISITTLKLCFNSQTNK